MREAWLPLAVLAALGAAPLLGFGGSYETTLMARTMILGMAAVSLAFLVGGAGLVSLGHAASVGVGAYTVAILDAHGITDADSPTGSDLLANVNPTYNWVRLAQRIPVRIVFDEVPEDFRMIAGRTATVSIIEDTPQTLPAQENAP